MPLERRETGAHFDVRIFRDVVVKTNRHVGGPDELRRLVEIQQSLADIDGIPWAEFDEESGLILEQRMPGDTIRRINTRITGDQRRAIDQRQRQVLEQIRERGFTLRDRTPQNVMFDLDTEQVSVIDFVEIFRGDDKIQAWRAT